MLNQILETLEKERQSVIDLQRLLVSIPALAPENGGDGERVKADKLKELLATYGLTDFTEYQVPDPRVGCGHRPNLALIIKGEDTSRTFWIISHLDVVPAGDEELWNTPPFELSVDGDELRGRGVEDNHQGIVSSVLLAKSIAALGKKPPINLGLLFAADEETNNKYGLAYLTEKHAELFGQNDLFLAPDSGAPDGINIEIAEKSILWLKITVNGKQCHASLPHQGSNSLTAAAAFILKAQALRQRFWHNDPLFDPPASTFEPTKKEANVQNVNTIPGRDVFYFDCRILPQYKLDDVLTVIQEMGREIEQTYHVQIEYEPIQKVQAPPATSSSSDIVKRLSEAVRTEYGKTPKLIGIGGGTVAAYLRKLGRDAVVWSTIYENAHQPNERANIKFAINDAKIMARVLFAAS